MKFWVRSLPFLLHGGREEGFMQPWKWLASAGRAFQISLGFPCFRPSQRAGEQSSKLQSSSLFVGSKVRDYKDWIFFPTRKIRSDMVQTSTKKVRTLLLCLLSQLMFEFCLLYASRILRKKVFSKNCFVLKNMFVFLLPVVYYIFMNPIPFL